VYGSPTAAVANDNMRAYYSKSNTGLDIFCNGEQSLGRGFEFFMTNPGTNWHDNNMTANGKGMVLNGAIIGPQMGVGGWGSPTMGNKWWGTWGSGDSQTYVYNGAHAAMSMFYVFDDPITNPVVNGGNPPFYRYAPISSIISTTTGGVGDCPVYEPGRNIDSLYEQIAQQHVDYSTNIIPSNWIGQYALWNAILADTSLVDSSATIAEFATLAASSRYKYLTDIEHLLAIGDFTDATTMLGYSIDPMANTSWDSVTQVQMADSTGADNIVENYQNFFKLYIKYMDSTLTGSDSLAIFALAGLCPERNGTVVFQARVLYSEIFNDLSMFNDDSCLDADTTYIAARHLPNNGNSATTAVQNYKVYPNPNDGNFVVQQYMREPEPVKAIIYDAVGREVYNSDMSFVNTQSNLNLGNLSPGLYLLELKDSKNEIFRFKFVVSK